MRYCILNLFSLLLLTNSLFGQKSVAQIDTFQKQIDHYCKKHAKPDFVTANISTGKKPTWKRFSSAKKLDRYYETHDVDTSADSWIFNRKLALSSITHSSGSGDWVNFVSYYFRLNGSLALISLDYRTFYGNFAVLRKIYFDEKGNIFRDNTKYYDLDYKKSIVPDKDYLKENFYLMNDFGFYKRANHLPFAKLLK